MKLFTPCCFAVMVSATTADMSGNSQQRSFFRKRLGYFHVKDAPSIDRETRGLESLMFELESDVLLAMSMSMSMSMSISLSYGPIALTNAPTPAAAPSKAPSASPSGFPSVSVSSNAPSVSPSTSISSAPSGSPSQNGDDDLVLAAPGSSQGANRSVSPLAIGAVVAVGTAGIMGIVVWLVAKRSRNKNVAVVADMSLAPVSILSDDHSALGGASVVSTA